MPNSLENTQTAVCIESIIQHTFSSAKEMTTGKKTGNSYKFVANTVYEFESVLFMLINYFLN